MTDVDAETKAIEAQISKANREQEDLEKELADICRGINSELKDYKLVQNYECSQDGTFFLADNKNNLLNIHIDSKEDQKPIEVEFNSDVLPLIKEKKEMHMKNLDKLCSEREKIGQETLNTQQELQTSQKEHEQFKLKTSEGQRDAKSKELWELEQKEKELDAEVSEYQLKIDQVNQEINRLIQ